MVQEACVIGLLHTFHKWWSQLFDQTFWLQSSFLNQQGILPIIFKTIRVKGTEKNDTSPSELTQAAIFLKIYLLNEYYSEWKVFHENKNLLLQEIL